MDMEQASYLNCVLFLGAICFGMALASVVLGSAALVGEIVSRYFGRWRRWAVIPLTVLALPALTLMLFWVMVHLPQNRVIPWWVSGCIGVTLVIGWHGFGIWAVIRRASDLSAPLSAEDPARR